MLLPEIGLQGQQRLLTSSVLVAGVGALGCGVAGYLAGAGVGTLLLADHDTVELGNIHRQVLYSTADVGELKVVAAERRLKAIQPEVHVQAYAEELDQKRAHELATEADVVLDCTDTFESRYAINSACLETRTPLVHGACLGFAGRVMTIVPGESPCFRCLCPEPPPPEDREGCSQVGIIGPVAGLVACVQVVEVMKLLLDIPQVLTGELLVIDCQFNDYERLEVRKWDECPDCGGLDVAEQ